VSDPAPLLLDDGTPVKVGDRVWRAHRGYALVTRAKVQRHWLTMWRESLAGWLFTTERAALEFALTESKVRLARYRKQACSEVRTIARLKERLAQKGRP
jgi:hypothetical protein